MRQTITIAAALGLAGTAMAGITEPVFSITATNADGVSGTTVFDSSQGTWNGDTFTFEMDEPYSIWDDSGTVFLAEVQSISTTVIEDPVVDLQFQVVASGSETAFLINSTLLSFDEIASPTAKATAGITITDQNGDGAELTGELGDGSAYRAVINGEPGTGDDLATLIGDFSAGVFGSETGEGAFDDGSGGFVSVGQPVSSISAQFEFSVSAFDAASGTSVFTVIPTPASATLLGLGGLVALRRRR